MIVLGIDPGTAITGYGVVKKRESNIDILDYGALTTPSHWSIGERLNYLFEQISSLLDLYNPDVVVMENVFFNKNIKTAISVGQAQGVIILAVKQYGKDIQTLTPLEVKSSIVGYGRASKSQIQYMVKEILRLRDIPKPDDVADALALCISFINKQKGWY